MPQPQQGILQEASQPPQGLPQPKLGEYTVMATEDGMSIIKKFKNLKRE